MEQKDKKEKEQKKGVVSTPLPGDGRP